MELFGVQKEVVTAAEALIMWTKSSAYLSHDDENLGSIDVGNLGDYVLIDTPLLEVEPDISRDTTVLKTFVNGEVVYGI